MTAQPITYKIYDVKTKQGNDRVLSPDVQLIKLLNPNVISVKENNTLKTVKTVNTVVLRTTSKKAFLQEVNSEKSIANFLDSIHKDRKFNAPNTITSALNKLKSTSSSPLKVSNKEIIATGAQRSSTQEGKVIGEGINFYLKKLGLNPIVETSNQTNRDFYDLSTYGDQLLNTEINFLVAPQDVWTVRSNFWQKATLIRLGFPSAGTNEEHLMGTLFETLYAIAHIQKNDRVKRTMLGALVKPFRKNPILTKYKFGEK